MDTIDKRVSIRKYEDRPVEKDKIDRILRAAFAAPSAGNQQPWEFYVITDKALITELSKISKYSGCLANAPVAIVNVCSPEGKRFAEVSPVDMAICTEHEWLAATEEDLGAVWIGVSPFEDRIKMASDLLKLTDGKYVFSILALGYPAESREPEDRYDADRVHFIE